MSIYWSLKSVPELASLTRKQRRRVHEKCLRRHFFHARGHGDLPGRGAPRLRRHRPQRPRRHGDQEPDHHAGQHRQREVRVVVLVEPDQAFECVEARTAGRQSRRRADQYQRSARGRQCRGSGMRCASDASATHGRADSAGARAGSVIIRVSSKQSSLTPQPGGAPGASTRLPRILAPRQSKCSWRCWTSGLIRPRPIPAALCYRLVRGSGLSWATARPRKRSRHRFGAREPNTSTSARRWVTRAFSGRVRTRRGRTLHHRAAHC